MREWENKKGVTREERGQAVETHKEWMKERQRKEERNSIETGGINR